MPDARKEFTAPLSARPTLMRCGGSLTSPDAFFSP